MNIFPSQKKKKKKKKEADARKLEGCERPYLGHPCIEMSKLGLVLFALS